MVLKKLTCPRIEYHWPRSNDPKPILEKWMFDITARIVLALSSEISITEFYHVDSHREEIRIVIPMCKAHLIVDINDALKDVLETPFKIDLE